MRSKLKRFLRSVPGAGSTVVTRSLEITECTSAIGSAMRPAPGGVCRSSTSNPACVSTSTIVPASSGSCAGRKRRRTDLPTLASSSSATERPRHRITRLERLFDPLGVHASDARRPGDLVDEGRPEAAQGRRVRHLFGVDPPTLVRHCAGTLDDERIAVLEDDHPFGRQLELGGVESAGGAGQGRGR